MHSTQFRRDPRGIASRTPLTGNRRAIESCEQFKRWFASTGHWVYDDRAHAARTWLARGITTLPQAPEGAAALLADWIAADTLPALIARLRADEAAAGVPRG